MKPIQVLSRVRFRREEGFAARVGYSVMRRDWASQRFGDPVPPILRFIVSRVTRRFVTVRLAS